MKPDIMEYITVNEKVTTWIEHTFQVANVNSEQEAIDKVIECYRQGKDPFDYDENIHIIDSVEMTYCEESMTPEENGGFATVEVINKDKEVVWDNSKLL